MILQSEALIQTSNLFNHDWSTSEFSYFTSNLCIYDVLEYA